MKLKKITFDNIGFRNLHNLNIDIADGITVIAGHNGIGKSTILGLIANCSEYTEHKTLFNKAFRSDFSEIFILNYEEDFNSREYGPSTADLIYKLDSCEITKRCSVSGNQKKLINKIDYKKFLVKVSTSTLTEKQKEALNEDNLYVHRMRVIPRTINITNQEFSEKYNVGNAAKIDLPTLYLGMSRISPIGEFDRSSIQQKISAIDPDTTTFIYNFFNAVIPFNQNKEKKVYSHTFVNNNKQSYVPEFGHSSLTISLGQDSLSSIATAIASFYNLKNLLGDEYNGGIIVIDEIEAGLHPRAQKNLLKELKKYSKQLSLQIIVTSHSLTIIKETLDESIAKIHRVNDVVYLMDTNIPNVMQNVSYLKIKNDMLLETNKISESNLDIVPLPPEIYIYFEDLEALTFLNGIFNYYKITDTFGFFGKKVNLVSAKLGCHNLLQMNKTPHFQHSIIILDSDMLEGQSNKLKQTLSEANNVVLLPATMKSSKYYGLPPDKIIYAFLLEKFNDCQNNREFWQNQTPDWFTTNYYQEQIKDISKFYTSKPIELPYNIDNVKNMDRDAMKQWYNGVHECLESCSIFSLWASENKDECDLFLEKIVSAISSIR